MCSNLFSAAFLFSNSTYDNCSLILSSDENVFEPLHKIEQNSRDILRPEFITSDSKNLSLCILGQYYRHKLRSIPKYVVNRFSRAGFHQFVRQFAFFLLLDSDLQFHFSNYHIAGMMITIILFPKVSKTRVFLTTKQEHLICDPGRVNLYNNFTISNNSQFK